MQICAYYSAPSLPHITTGSPLAVRNRPNYPSRRMKPRTHIMNLSEIPNVGPATTRYLNLIGIRAPFELIGQDPYELFRLLCRETGKKFDPCLADVFISAVRFMEGAPPHDWWFYTPERKKVMRSGNQPS